MTERPDLRVVGGSNADWQSRDEWLAAGKVLGERTERDRWALGDWACHGERAYGDLAEAAAKIDVSYQTLRHLASVARKVELCRRRHNLSWAHHAEVASLPATVGDDLLARAEAEGWSRAVLREEVRAASREVQLQARITHLEREARRAATEPRDEVSQARSRLEAERRVVRDAARRMTALVGALAASPVIGDLHGNAQRGTARDLRRLADAMAADVNAALEQIEATARAIGGPDPNGGGG